MSTCVGHLFIQSTCYGCAELGHQNVDEEVDPWLMVVGQIVVFYNTPTSGL